jgi:hypothetical protein
MSARAFRPQSYLLMSGRLLTTRQLNDLESNIFAAAYQQLLRVLWNTVAR